MWTAAILSKRKVGLNVSVEVAFTRDGTVVFTATCSGNDLTTERIEDWAARQIADYEKRERLPAQRDAAYDALSVGPITPRLRQRPDAGSAAEAMEPRR